MDPIAQLLDENNNDDVILYNEHGEPVRFEQIALIDLYGGTYAILRPVEVVEGMAEDEALVFEVVDDDEDPYITVCTDDDIIDQVFDIYYEMLEEAGEE